MGIKEIQKEFSHYRNRRDTENKFKIYHHILHLCNVPIYNLKINKLNEDIISNFKNEDN